MAFTDRGDWRIGFGYQTEFPTFSKTGLRKNRGVDVQMEMGDVYSYLFQLAFMLNVDLDEMWLKHQTKVVTRKYNNHTIITNDVQ